PYLRQLDAVLRFDMSYSGYTVPVSADTRAAFTFSGIVKAKKLTLSIMQGNQSKQYKDIPLSGSLDIDRRQIHKMSDLIVKNLFGRDGVASSKMLFAIQAQQDNNWVSEIWQSDWDGGNLTQITKEKSYCVSPVFIPAKAGRISNRFIYVSYKLGQPKIYLASTDEGKGRRIVDLKGNQLLPTVSPNRNKIAFICDAAGRTDLFIQSINAEQGEMGKPVQLFSYPRSTQASPTFSPDGSQIAFVSDKDGSPRIYVIPTQVKKQRADATLITKKNSESSCPSWSPDGTKLAYSAKTKGIRQIWIYDFNAGEERQLTDGPGNKENPCWASDSMHMVFNSTDASSSEI
ncbi:MAG TPA: Tol-Pal system protein TolB, partial [Rhabdochlamydiaceae bacterium]